jgi:hypothetical protein
MSDPHLGWFRIEEEAVRLIQRSFDKPCDCRNALAFFVMLCRKANLKGGDTFEDTIGSMAHDASFTYRDAQKALALVESIGLVKIERKKLPGTMGNAPSIYTVVRLSPCDITSEPSDITGEPSRTAHVHDLSRTFPKNPQEPPKTTKKRELPLSPSEITYYISELGVSKEDALTDGQYYFDHWTENGFTNGGKAIKNWKLTLKKWHGAGWLPSQKRRNLGQRPENRRNLGPGTEPKFVPRDVQPLAFLDRPL